MSRKASGYRRSGFETIIRLTDPNLHYHMVLCKLCVREDGLTGTFDGRTLVRRQMKGNLFLLRSMLPAECLLSPEPLLVGVRSPSPTKAAQVKLDTDNSQPPAFAGGLGRGFTFTWARLQRIRIVHPCGVQSFTKHRPEGLSLP